MDNSEVGTRLNLFGDGNVEVGVELFKEQHLCGINRYCRWPGFELSRFESNCHTG